MKLVKKIENMDNLIMTRIEYLNYMKISYENILENILLKKNEYEYKKDLVDYYMEKYSKINTSFSCLTREIIKEIDKEYLKEKYFYDFNFEEESLYIYEREEVYEKKRMGAVSGFCCKNNGKQ